MNTFHNRFFYDHPFVVYAEQYAAITVGTVSILSGHGSIFRHKPST